MTIEDIMVSLLAASEDRVVKRIADILKVTPPVSPPVVVPPVVPPVVAPPVPPVVTPPGTVNGLNVTVLGSIRGGNPLYKYTARTSRLIMGPNDLFAIQVAEPGYSSVSIGNVLGIATCCTDTVMDPYQAPVGQQGGGTQTTNGPAIAANQWLCFRLAAGVSGAAITDFERVSI